MAIIIGAVLCLLSIAVLLYPFIKAPRPGLVDGTLEEAGLEIDGDNIEVQFMNFSTGVEDKKPVL